VGSGLHRPSHPLPLQPQQAGASQQPATAPVGDGQQQLQYLHLNCNPRHNNSVNAMSIETDVWQVPDAPQLEYCQQICDCCHINEQLSNIQEQTAS